MKHKRNEGAFIKYNKLQLRDESNVNSHEKINGTITQKRDVHNLPELRVAIYPFRTGCKYG